MNVFFNFARRSTHGTSLPQWLTEPGPVLLRKFVQNGKNDDLVEKVQLIEANPMYARVLFPGGRESNVSLRHTAPCPQRTNDEAGGLPANDLSEEVSGQPDNDIQATSTTQTSPLIETPVRDISSDTHIHTPSVSADVNPSIEVANLSSPMPTPDTSNPTTNPTKLVLHDAPRRSSRINRAVPPKRFQDNFLSFVWREEGGGPPHNDI